MQKPTEQINYRSEIQKPVYDRVSLHHFDYGTDKIEDLLQNSEFCGILAAFFEHRVLTPNRVVDDAVSERQDEYIRYLDELGLVTVDWERYRHEKTTQDNKLLDIKIHFKYNTNEIRDLLDLFDQIDLARDEFRSRHEEQMYFEKKLWKEPHKEKSPATQRVYTCGNLKLDLTKAQLVVKGKSPHPISPNSKVVKLLRLLMAEKGVVVENVKIVKTLRLPSYRPGENKNNDESVKKDAQSIRRDMRKMLLEAGMTDKQINSMIQSKTNLGYIMIDC